MNQSELKALLGKTVLIRGCEHLCCGVGNDRLLLLQCAAKDEPLFRKGEPVQYIVACHPRWDVGTLVWAQGAYFPIVPLLDGLTASAKAFRAAADYLVSD
ncbi:hypothetical protein [Butyricicoccus sp.]|uniref:hypothetical protein n=1 Tax=Butyricicoccus sp. TaxID=2049021 RepID=UPI003AAD9B34